ncbi:MAG: hypothetical protein HY294_05260 [Candidatus Rokubacteria bacterium]|nr:hypothetical protein [Candidatus Rokubacteria bacterium]MBI3825386.1 hypothetical protein [Candidatus Rokubacteria bacterium]
MTRRARAVVGGAVAVGLALVVAGAPSGPTGRPAPAEANGDTQRQVQGRVVAVDAAAGTLVVAREFRGKTTRVMLTAAPTVQVFACADERASLDRVKAGMVVSAFYEVIGAEGVVNLVVVEPGP